MPNNKEFLTLLFGETWPWVHVTDFAYDPHHIPKEQQLISWGGDYFSRYHFREKTNQYFTISNFYCDEEGKARRRKALYWKTPVIVLDDVKEKLHLEEVQKLPEPTWVLETSPGSEQWGYLLDRPCEDRNKVENLLDGLVENGLAPAGKDPGMKGVTRYVRLPDGYNTKASKMVNGEPFKCRMLQWNPFNTVSIDDLALPFSVDLDAPRREVRADGAANVADHPLLGIPEIIKIKEVRSDGRFDITCPWVDEHTNRDDSGTAIFTNADNSIGFKCHHGSCEHRTGADLLNVIESVKPGFKAELSDWQVGKQFDQFEMPKPSAPPAPDFTQPVRKFDEFTGEQVKPEARKIESAQAILGTIRTEIPGSIEQREKAAAFLKVVENMAAIDKVHWHQQLRDVMRWNQKEFNLVLNGLRAEWYEDTNKGKDFFTGLVYVGELDQFLDIKKNIFYRPQAFQNNFSHLDVEARKRALEGKITKVDRIDYAPKEPKIFTKLGSIYVNTWSDVNLPQGVAGDVSRWIGHWDKVGWVKHRKHMLQWMAWTILHPETKINHILMLGGAEGIGKDFLLHPLKYAMGEHHQTIDGDALMDQFNDHLLAVKYLHINEIELSNHKEADSVGKKIKPLAAAPPDKLRVNSKGVKAVPIRNIVNCTMGTNSTLPFKTKELSRRLYGMWSDVSIRGHDGNVTQEWRDYWSDRWYWMEHGGGLEACIYYLRNCVDLSDFDPYQAPEVTSFVRHIHNSSKSPLVQTVEDLFTDKRYGFSQRIFTVRDVIAGMRLAENMNSNSVFLEARYVTPMKVFNVLMQMPGVRAREVEQGKGISKTYWVIGDEEELFHMDDEEFLRHYWLEMKRMQDRPDNILPMGLGA